MTINKITTPAAAAAAVLAHSNQRVRGWPRKSVVFARGQQVAIARFGRATDGPDLRQRVARPRRSTYQMTPTSVGQSKPGARM